MNRCSTRNACSLRGTYPVRSSLGRCALEPPSAKTLGTRTSPKRKPKSGAELLLVPNGSPYARGRFDTRMTHMVARVVETGLPLVYLNLVGGQDDQVFDGASFVLNPGGKLAVQLPAHEEALVSVDFTQGPDGWRAEPGPRAALPDDLAQDYRTMCMGLGDYLRKSGVWPRRAGAVGGALILRLWPPLPPTRLAPTTCIA